MSKKSINTNQLALPLIIILAVALRLVAISTRPIWYDESFAILFAEKGLQAMLAGTLSQVGGSAADVHPLAYYVLLNGWMALFGQSLTVVRLLSVLFGVLAILIIYVFARALAGERMALIAGLLMALSPFQIHYAQEIRMYSLLVFLLAAATLALWFGMRKERWYWWGIFSITIALAQYVHNLAVFYTLPLTLTPVIFRNWRAVRNVFISGCIAIGLYLPWLVQLPSQFEKVRQSYWTTSPNFSRLATTFIGFTTNLPLPATWLPVALFITFFLLILAGWQTIKAYRLNIPQAGIGLWLGYLVFAPILLLFAFSQWQPIYIERGLIASGAMFLVWLSWVFTETKKPYLIQGLIAALIILGFGVGYYQHVVYRGFPYGQYSEIVKFLRDSSSEQDIILHSNKLTMLPAYYYDRNLPQEYIQDIPGSGADTLALATQETLGLIAEPGVEEGVNNAKKVWFVIFKKAIDEYKALGYSTHPHLEWLQKNFHLDRQVDWGDISIYVFSR
jgi:4-amino-4-deoxy-L-arabinose transferase-like glycosyltransferase